MTPFVFFLPYKYALIFFVLFLSCGASVAHAGESGCRRDYNPDGSPTLCLKQYLDTKRDCPSAGQPCLDPSLVGAWMLGFYKLSSVQSEAPNVGGWNIRPNGDVYPLAINFDTGSLVEGKHVWNNFFRFSIGCNGALYTTGNRAPHIGCYYGKYQFSNEKLIISVNKSDDLQEYVPVTLGEKFTEPVKYLIDMKFDGKPIVVPRIAPRLPAYAILAIPNDRDATLNLRITTDVHKIYITVPNILTVGQRIRTAAGGARIEQSVNDHVVMEFRPKDDPLKPNKIEIDILDFEQGRIAGRFEYTVVRDTPYRFEGRFDLPLYIRHKNNGEWKKK